ncbi:hypothetical protein QJS10_CPA09g00502 [Acorus calamus]|uniref:Uncharacterized protein n=1 Tax=Acorus calamus TaxID=4465 RepID=A0AAV9E574_ACOCL|nr:hypothetical protein QJS10_CPA09g00502 [Acorus calamus]
MPSTFDADIVSWLPEAVHGHPNQLFMAPSEPFIPLRDQTCEIYNPISQSAGFHVDCHVTDHSLPTWHHGFTSAELLSVFLPPPEPMHENVMQHQTMGGADMTEMEPREQDGTKPSLLARDDSG